ncbi:MAG: EamA family transporter [Dehalococcoidia bacterium]|nr:EamA family transporter [Dehalococcoidia bacterium]
MSWIVVTLLSSAVLGMIGVLDKAFLYHYARSHLTLPFLIGLGHIPIGIVFIAISPLDDLTFPAVGWSLAAGIFGGLGGVIFFRVVARREVSRAVPVTQTFPIFVAPMAVLFLGESLRIFDWFAILVTVAGAVMISIRQDAGGRGLVIDRSFYELLLASLLMACMNLAAKQALETLPVFLVHGLRSLGLVPMLLAFSVRRESVDELRRMVAERSPALAIFGVNEYVIANTGMILNLWATSLGPVSLVTALSASTSLFLLVYSILLSLRFRNMLGEQVGRQAVIVKSVATTLIVVGVAVISLR